ncbi:MAG: small basic protein [Candidatus Omnitrophica bacterium]|nr:small basic protein [Candidatus Omnitrophota bacterium]
MSLHSSLKVDKAGAAARTVMTRIERIKDMMKKGQWSEERTVTNLPKVKVVRVKAGKKKAKEEGAAGAAAPAAAGAAKPAAAAAKPAAGAKK